MKTVKRRNRAATMNRILRALAELIVLKSIDKVGINAVAAQAQVNKVLIYRYFGGWNGLLETFYQQILNRIATASTPDQYIRFFHQELVTNPAWQQILIWQLVNQETEVGRRLMKIQEESFQKLQLPAQTAETIQFI